MSSVDFISYYMNVPVVFSLICVPSTCLHSFQQAHMASNPRVVKFKTFLLSRKLTSPKPLQTRNQIREAVIANKILAFLFEDNLLLGVLLNICVCYTHLTS